MSADAKYYKNAYPMITVEELDNDSVPDIVKRSIEFMLRAWVSDTNEPVSQALRGFLYHKFRYSDEENEGYLYHWECECPHYIDGPDDGNCAKCEEEETCDKAFLGSTREEREGFARKHLSEEHQREWLLKRIDEWVDCDKWANIDLSHASAMFLCGWSHHERYVSSIQENNTTQIL